MKQLINSILRFTNLETVQGDTDEYFDMDLYREPVENSKRNILIEKIQMGLLAIPFSFWVSMIFLNYYFFEVILFNLLPLAAAWILDMLKDKEIQAAYDKYAEWKLERDEILEEEENDY